MKQSRLRKKSNNRTALCKDRIQGLLRELAINRDGGCVLRKYPEAGVCGGYSPKSGKMILQAEHLNTRERNVSFGDMRNIVTLCLRHHHFFKQQYGPLYWELIEKVIGPERWAWLKKVQMDRKTYTMGFWEWSKTEWALKRELESNKN